MDTRFRYFNNLRSCSSRAKLLQPRFHCNTPQCGRQFTWNGKARNRYSRKCPSLPSSGHPQQQQQPIASEAASISGKAAHVVEAETPPWLHSADSSSEAPHMDSGDDLTFTLEELEDLLLREDPQPAMSCDGARQKLGNAEEEEWGQLLQATTADAAQAAHNINIGFQTSCSADVGDQERMQIAYNAFDVESLLTSFDGASAGVDMDWMMQQWDCGGPVDQQQQQTQAAISI